jgi:hypothetical protein
MLLLLQSNLAVPRFHGNGFVQLPLGGSRRLHVWHPSLPPIEGHNATIHNHVWDMQSRVLLGCLTHRTYDVVRDYYSLRCTHDLYQLGEHRPDVPVGLCTVALRDEYHMSAGSVYVFGAGRFHESDSEGLTATLMEKRPGTAYLRSERPLVVCPRDEPPVDAFAPDYQPSEYVMWDAIGEALDLMGPESLQQVRDSV